MLLARLAAVCGAVSGIQAVGRNKLDVAGLARPAVILQDGIEQTRDMPDTARYTEIARMELSPGLTVITRGGPDDIGPLLSLYRSRILAAVLRDSELRDLTGTNGGIRYEGCLVAAPDAEAKEYRLDITLNFYYTLTLSEL